jgi:uncharacterized OsmC-like protein
MMTVMGISAREKNIPLKNLEARVVKHMHPDPRRVVGVEVHLDMDGAGSGERERAVLEQVARTCPVALSLARDLQQDIHFNYR